MGLYIAKFGGLAFRSLSVVGGAIGEFAFGLTHATVSTKALRGTATYPYFLQGVLDVKDQSAYLERLLSLYDEKRKRFQLSFTLLMVGAVAFFFFVFFPYLTLLGNRADCLSQQVPCTQLEASILEDRFTEVTTSWGNIPISTAEVVVLFPLMVGAGFMAVSAQLVGLMRLRQAIQQEAKALGIAMDVTLVAPVLLDPKRGLLDLIAGAGALGLPVLLGVYGINLIFVRLGDLQRNLPYSQASRFYYAVYLLAVLLFLLGSARVAVQFVTFWRATKREQNGVNLA